MSKTPHLQKKSLETTRATEAPICATRSPGLKQQPAGLGLHHRSNHRSPASPPRPLGVEQNRTPPRPPRLPHLRLCRPPPKYQNAKIQNSKKHKYKYQNTEMQERPAPASPLHPPPPPQRLPPQPARPNLPKPTPASGPKMAIRKDSNKKVQDSNGNLP